MYWQHVVGRRRPCGLGEMAPEINVAACADGEGFAQAVT